MGDLGAEKGSALGVADNLGSGPRSGLSSSCIPLAAFNKFEHTGRPGEPDWHHSHGLGNNHRQSDQTAHNRYLATALVAQTAVLSRTRHPSRGENGISADLSNRGSDVNDPFLPIAVIMNG